MKPCLRLLLFMLVIGNLGTTWAAAPAPYDNPICRDPSIRTVQVLKDHRRPELGTSVYRYQRFEVTPGAPWVVSFPGGPGGRGTMAADPAIVAEKKRNIGIPQTYNWISLDPRGLQCNRMADQDWPDDTVNTWQMANDAAKVIEAERLNLPILFGFSYGTLWATVTTTILETHGFAIRSLVLGGVLGAYRQDGSGSTLQQLNIELAAQTKALPRELQQKLENDDSRVNLDWTLQALLTRPIRVIDGHVKNLFSETVRNAAESGSFAEAMETSVFDLLFRHVPDSTKYDRDGSTYVYSQVGCREIQDPIEDFVTFSDGKFVTDPDSFPGCDGRSYQGPLDTALYPVSTRILYFQGDRDVAAPIIGARYHLTHHPEAERIFLRIPNGGHSWLMDVLPDCMDEFWGVATGNPVSDESFRSCAVKPELTYLRPR